MFRAFVYDLSRFLLVPAAMAAGTSVIALIAQERFSAGIFLLVAFGTFVGSWLLGKVGSVRSTEGATWRALSAVAGVWLLISIVGAIPFWAGSSHMSASQSAIFSSPLNAWFESMSGFTSTGLTMSSDPAALPRSIQWWRSLMEWVGGVGVVALALVVVDKSERSKRLYEGEGRSATLGEEFSGTARSVWKIYGALTAGCFLAYLAVGMHWWEAVNHAMVTPSTGGFSVRADSFASYPLLTQTVALFFTLTGAVSFPLYYRAWNEKSLTVGWRNSALRTFGMLLLLGIALLLGANEVATLGEAAPALVFQGVSALATAGLSSANVATWPTPLLLPLIAAMFVGGGSGSTSGGLKADRVMWLLKGAKARLLLAWSDDDSGDSIRVNAEPVESLELGRRLRAATTLLVLYLAVGACGVFILSLTVAAPLEWILFDATSALGGVGLSTGVTDAALDPVPKVTLIALMWLGRLEVIAVLVLVIAPFRPSPL